MPSKKVLGDPVDGVPSSLLLVDMLLVDGNVGGSESVRPLVSMHVSAWCRCGDRMSIWQRSSGDIVVSL